MAFLSERLIDPEDIPPPDSVAVEVRLMGQAFIRWIGKEFGREAAESYLRELAQAVADEEIVHPLLPNRPAGQRADQLRAQKAGAARVRMALPLMIAALPPANGKKRKG